jgi:hypothetical protein
MAFALFVKRIEIVEVEPGASELERKTAHPRIAQQASGFSPQHFGVVQLVGGRQLA